MVIGWAGFILQKKLKVLKISLRKWNEEVLGNVSHKLKVTEEESSS
mgnify:CR=1 FL=1